MRNKYAFLKIQIYEERIKISFKKCLNQVATKINTTVSIKWSVGVYEDAFGCENVWKRFLLKTAFASIIYVISVFTY